MDNMVTFSFSGRDLNLRLTPGVVANLAEMLEMLDLDGFSMDAADRADLAETKLQLEMALGAARMHADS